MSYGPPQCDLNKREIVTHSQTTAFTRLHVVMLIRSLVSTMKKCKLFPIPATSLGLKFPNFHTTEAITLDTMQKKRENENANIKKSLPEDHQSKFP